MHGFVPCLTKSASTNTLCGWVKRSDPVLFLLLQIDGMYKCLKQTGKAASKPAAAPAHTGSTASASPRPKPVAAQI